ncbi:MAG: hypothetical protein RLY31_2693 [Bacteroidota bacterium]|jgi:hypothetical protein
MLRFCLLPACLLLADPSVRAQSIDNNGCVGGNFGIEADLYSGQLPFGDLSGASPTNTDDWFQGSTGRGVIDETDSAAIRALLLAGGNPLYEARMSEGIFSRVDNRIWVDAIFAKDFFGGTGFIDSTSYVASGKNGQDPAVWPTGPANVLGKNDLLDLAGHMRRDGPYLTDNLWFYGFLARTEPGGSAYVDFEFFIEEVTFSQATGFTTGGPDMGHTAFTFDGTGNITRLGDIIFNISMTNGGTTPQGELRIWVRRKDYDIFSASPPENLPFTFGSEFDGAGQTALYGYANILPVGMDDACGYINLAGELPTAPPWKYKGTKFNTVNDNYGEYYATEVGFDLTTYGLENSGLIGSDSCDFPYRTYIVKSRASEAFTAQLKDFGGPYAWAKPSSYSIGWETPLSCLNPTTELIGLPERSDATYNWSTLDGNIVGPANQRVITVDQPGTYTLEVTLVTGCPVEPYSVTVGYDATKPFFESTAVVSTISCNGNDGSLDLTVSGATAPYDLEWTGPSAYTNTTLNDGDGLQTLTGLAPGAYHVTVTDAVGCTSTATATVAARTATTITPTNSNISCAGGNDGSISLSVAGNGPFTFSWSNGNTTAAIGNLTAGSYSVTLTDADGCSSTASYTLTQPAVLSLSLVGTDDSNPLPGTGASNANGSIDLTVSGGTSPYGFLWNTGAVTEDLSDLHRASYSVTVTDNNGCTATGSVSLYEPEICNDGIDNDGDGLTDCDDPDCAAPSPGTPTNPSACVGETGILYTVTDNPAVNYSWTHPDGSTLVSGQGTHQIELLWTTSQGGQVCVRTVTDPAGCESAPVCVTANPNKTPVTPSGVTVD